MHRVGTALPKHLQGLEEFGQGLDFRFQFYDPVIYKRLDFHTGTTAPASELKHGSHLLERKSHLLGTFYKPDVGGGFRGELPVPGMRA